MISSVLFKHSMFELLSGTEKTNVFEGKCLKQRVHLCSKPASQPAVLLGLCRAGLLLSAARSLVSYSEAFECPSEMFH